MRMKLLLCLIFTSPCLGLKINFGASDVLELFGYSSNDIDPVIEEQEVSDDPPPPPPHEEVAK